MRTKRILDVATGEITIVPFTAEEEVARDAEEAKAANDQQQQENAEQAVKLKRAALDALAEKGLADTEGDATAPQAVKDYWASLGR